jgi:uncharacterized protein (DUF3820 family)
MPTSEELLKWFSGESVEGMPENRPVKKSKKSKIDRKRSLTPEEIARSAGIDLDKLMKPSNNLSWRFTISTDGTDALLKFGKHKGKTVSKIYEEDPHYLNWILRSDFPEELKDVIRYRQHVTSAEAKAELHGFKSLTADKREGETGKIKWENRFDDGLFAGMVPFDTHPEIEELKLRCPSCSSSDIIGLARYSGCSVEEYLFTCLKCETRFTVVDKEAREIKCQKKKKKSKKRKKKILSTYTLTQT